MGFKHQPSARSSARRSVSTEPAVDSVKQLDDLLIKQSFNRAYRLSQGQDIFQSSKPQQFTRPRYTSPKGGRPANMKKTAPKGAAPIPPYRTGYWRGSNSLGIKKR